MTMTAADSADEGLKPCPFCNNSTEQKVVRSLIITDYGNDGFFALCDAATGHVGCGASSPWKETPELAIAAWNRRATPAPVPSAEELSAEEIDLRGLQQLMQQVTKGLDICDNDLMGNPITNYDVLLMGAYRDCLLRLVNAAVKNAQAKRAVPSSGTFSTEVVTSPAARKGKLAALNDLVRSGVAVTGFECDPVTILEGGPPIQRDTTDAVPAGGAVAVRNVPDYDEANHRQACGIATALDRFVLENEPAGLEKEAQFRSGLQAVLSSPIGAGERETIERWISVEDRLPERNTWCLVCYEGNRLPLGSMSHWFDGERFHDINSWSVTHWMPLPAPPTALSATGGDGE